MKIEDYFHMQNPITFSIILPYKFFLNIFT